MNENKPRPPLRSGLLGYKGSQRISLASVTAQWAKLEYLFKYSAHQPRWDTSTFNVKPFKKAADVPIANVSDLSAGQRTKTPCMVCQPPRRRAAARAIVHRGEKGSSLYFAWRLVAPMRGQPPPVPNPLNTSLESQGTTRRGLPTFI